MQEKNAGPLSGVFSFFECFRNAFYWFRFFMNAFGSNGVTGPVM